MATALKVIERAFSKIGVKAAETPLTSAEVQDGRDVLNDMLSSWDSTGTLKGAVPVGDVGDELIVPRYAIGAIKANLAIRLASEYDKAVTQGLAFDASDSLKEMVKSSIDLSNVDLPSTLPVGSGNSGDTYDTFDQFFAETDKENF